MESEAEPPVTQEPAPAPEPAQASNAVTLLEPAPAPKRRGRPPGARNRVKQVEIPAPPPSNAVTPVIDSVQSLLDVFERRQMARYAAKHRLYQSFLPP